MNLEYGFFWPSTRALGPGKRFAIWAQGCPRSCFKCASPELQPTGEGKSVDVETFADMIVQTPEINGITISGGEPMMQADALEALLDAVSRERPELTVILFTGFRIEDLQSQRHRALLRHVDVLIDGEYVDSLNDDIGLRGSSNQRILFLTPRLLEYREQIERGRRKREMHMLNELELLTIGIADRVVINQKKQSLDYGKGKL